MFLATASLLILLLFIPCASIVKADIVSRDKHVGPRDGEIRYHYDTSVQNPCAAVVILGVGTEMEIDQYDEISQEICQGQNVTTVIADPVPGFMVKFLPKPFANQVNSIVANLGDLIPACSNTAGTRHRDHDHGARNRSSSTSLPRIIIGGHSSSGTAAFKAVLGNLLTFEPLGFLGLDPFNVGCKSDGSGNLLEDHNINTVHHDSNIKGMKLPGLYWGFSRTTCWVNVNTAAKCAYHRTDKGHRFLFQVQNPNVTMKHCSFTDTGCCEVCPIPAQFKEEARAIRRGVGLSLQVFLRALVDNDLGNKAPFEKIIPDIAGVDTKLFAGNDVVPDEDRVKKSMLAQNVARKMKETLRMIGF